MCFGGTFNFTIEDAGPYDYLCSIHQGMGGVVIFEE
jgi:plastocyanin